MATITTIKMGLLLARLKLGSIFTTDKTYPKDPNPENWRTVNGAKVHLNNGKIDGGAGGKFESNAWVGKVKHGNNSFFPLNQMNYSAKAKTNAKSSQVTSQAGGAGASAAMEKVKTASQNKSASAVAEGQTSAIAAMQQYMEQKKKQPVAPEPEEDIPFGGPEPSNDPPEKVAKQLINKLQKKYADQPQEYKEAIDKALKALAKGDEEPMSHLLDADLTPKGQEQVWGQISTVAKLMKAKKITPLAAKNIVAAAIGNPGNLALVKLGEIWKANPPDTTPKKTPTLQEQLKGIWKTSSKEKYEAFKNKHKLKALQIMHLSTASDHGATESQLKAMLKKFKAENKTKADKYQKPAMGMKPEKPKEATAPQVNATSKPTDWPPDYKLPKGTQMLFDKSKDLNNSLFALNSEKAAKGLPDHQRAAINRYTGGSSHLRDWLVYGKTDEHYKDNYYTGGMTGAAMQKCADDISAGLKIIDHPDMLVTRKCSLKDWATKENPEGISFEDLQQMKKNGTVFENQAFLSTTPIKGGTYGASNSAMRHFFVPKKAPGGYIASISEYDIEKEFLLDKKTKTRIIKVEKDQHGIIHVYEEVVL